MSGAGLIEMLAARLGGRGMRRSAPALREVLASAMPNRAPVTAYEPIASRLDDPMAEGAMLSGTNDVSTPMPNAIRTGPDAGSAQTGRLPDTAIGGGLRRLGTDDAYIDYRAEPYAEEWFVTHQQIDDPAMRGQGLGVSAYEDLIGRAREAGASAVVSDTRVSESASRVYGALERRGYQVTRTGDGRYRVATQRGGENWTDLYTGMRGDTNRPWRGHEWTVRDRTVASEYGPNVRQRQGDISGAVTIRSQDDLRQALGPRADELMTPRRGEIFDYLDNPAIREELRARGVGAVHFPDDSMPTSGAGNRWHESYLILDENRLRNAPDGGPVQAGNRPLRRIGDLPDTEWIKLQREMRDSQIPFEDRPMAPDLTAEEILAQRDAANREFLNTFDPMGGDRIGAQTGRAPVGQLRPAVQDFPGGQPPVTYTGDNHFFAAEAARKAGARNLDDIGGFVDEAGNYFTREEAASLLGITRRRAGSEDLYPSRDGPNAGSDRNALQRALRERMERE